MSVKLKHMGDVHETFIYTAGKNTSFTPTVLNVLKI